ncbi:hypothetical protein VNO78_12837 [Psophocarpus tetragonolobus]|uniref:Uncharacterized protein n=1 Tax=Psophocarpus tetragonolobus TaxID=3891 RepID=A0AAN9SXE4_PSOTE
MSRLFALSNKRKLFHVKLGPDVAVMVNNLTINFFIILILHTPTTRQIPSPTTTTTATSSAPKSEPSQHCHHLHHHSTFTSITN